MESCKTSSAHARDFFRVYAPVLAVERALSGRPKARRGGQALVFELHRGGEPAREVRLDGQTVPVVPYPYANQGLVELVLDPRPYAPTLEPDVLIYVPCHPFHQVADEHGVQRLTKLALSPGSACDDTVLSNLGACLAHAAGPAASENGPVIDHVAQAMTTHIAQKYGGLEAPSPPQSGGLSPWQLRLARNTFDANLDGSVSLDDLAKECGLSVSQFSRAFKRSTGVAPHQWLMHRRIDVAKDLIRDGISALAEVALSCGFSDQSHLTRAFARATGLTPGRWRASHRN